MINVATKVAVNRLNLHLPGRLYHSKLIHEVLRKLFEHCLEENSGSGFCWRHSWLHNHNCRGNIPSCGSGGYVY